MPAKPPWRTAALASSLLLATLQGCAAPMTAPHTARYPPPGHFPATANRLKDGPYRFWQHNFGAYCFDTWGCRVVYGPYVVLDEPESRRFASATADRLKWMNGGYVGLENFQGAVVIDWHANDRAPLHAELELSEIFADGLVRYDVPAEGVDPDASVPDPDIVVEIDDRTVRVYMKALISLKAPRNPANRYTNSVDENVLVYEHRY